MTDPSKPERFAAYPNKRLVFIEDSDGAKLTGEVADRILGDREAAVIWNSDLLGHIVFPRSLEGWDMAQIFVDQLNDLDGDADAEQAATLIDSAADLAEQIEADSAPDLTAAQRRGLAAYQRAAVLPLYPYGEGCGEQWSIGDRVRIGDPGDPYYAGALAGTGLYYALLGRTATVLLPQNPFCPLIVLLDDDSDVVALPHASLYVRRAE